jgi:hypothetical protein
MRGYDPRRRGPPVGQRQRQTVSDVLLDGYDEGVALVAVVEPNRDAIGAGNHHRAKPMHPIDHPHRGSMNHNRWQPLTDLDQRASVLLDGTVQPGRVTRDYGIHRHQFHRIS